MISLIKAAYEQSFDTKNARKELQVIRQKEKQTIEEFGTRVHEILDWGIEAAREKFNDEKFVVTKTLLIEEAIDRFLNGLTNDTIMLLLTKDDIDSLTFAIKLPSKLEHKLLT